MGMQFDTWEDGGGGNRRRRRGAGGGSGGERRGVGQVVEEAAAMAMAREHLHARFLLQMLLSCSLKAGFTLSSLPWEVQL